LDRPKEPVEPRDHIKHWAKEITRSPITFLENLGLLEKGQPTDLIDAIDGLIEDLQDIRVQRDTEIIDLTIWGPSPQLAEAIANTMADLLVEKMRSITQNQASEAYEFAKEQVLMAEASLREAEEKVIALKGKETIVSLEKELELILRRIDELRSARTDTIGDLQEAQSKLVDLKNQLTDLKPMVVSTSVIAANPVTDKVKTSKYDLSSKLASLRTERSRTHPQVKELQAQIAELEALLKNESSMIPESETRMLNPIWQDLAHQVANLKSTVAGLQAKIQVWTQELDTIEHASIALSRNEAILERLTRDKETHEERYRTLKTKLLELEVQRLARSSEFDIMVIDKATVLPNAKPDYPDLEVFMIVGFLLSVMLALGLPLVREYIDDSFGRASEIEKVVEIPILGTLPEFSRSELTTMQYAGGKK
jgi:uncharacterized protein involved in exopolysaccharide biosynthesis